MPDGTIGTLAIDAHPVHKHWGPIRLSLKAGPAIQLNLEYIVRGVHRAHNPVGQAIAIDIEQVNKGTLIRSAFVNLG